MIRIATFTAGCALLALGSGWHMFAAKYDLRQMDRQIDKVAVQIRDTRAQAADLHTEYEALSDVGRLKGLAEQVLDLRASQAAQTLPYGEIDRHLPPVGVPPPVEPAAPIAVSQAPSPVAHPPVAPPPVAPAPPAPQAVAAAAPAAPPSPPPAAVQASVPQVPRQVPHPPAASFPVVVAAQQAPSQPTPRVPAPTVLHPRPEPQPAVQRPNLPTLPVDAVTRLARAPSGFTVPAVTSALGMARSMLGTSQPGRQ